MTDFSSAEIRLETAKDPAGMLSLAGHAGWNQTLSDCAVVTGSENSLAVYAFCGERLAGCAGCFLFGDHDLCHINMVVTHADFRRRGIAKRMVSFLMEKTACRTCRLYATCPNRYKPSNPASFAICCQRAVHALPSGRSKGR